METPSQDDLFPFKKDDRTRRPLTKLPEPPPWRLLGAGPEGGSEGSGASGAAPDENERRGAGMILDDEVVEAVNAALVLRRPLMVTGKPGTGKSSLAYAVAHQLDLGRVMVWPITSRSALQQGLYTYDAIARLQDSSLARSRPAEADGSPSPGGDRPTDPTPDIGRYIRLGPLGTALLPARRPGIPRVLLIDEIDKSDIDLPSDLLHVFEEGRYEIPELSRLPRGEEFDVISVRPFDGEEPVPIWRGRVRCDAFPFVVLTSNGEREFPPAFLRRCVRLRVREPGTDELTRIVASRLTPGPEYQDAIKDLIDDFVRRRDGVGADGRKDLATDQLLNAVYLLMHHYLPEDRGRVRELVFRSLAEQDGGLPE